MAANRFKAIGIACLATVAICLGPEAPQAQRDGAKGIRIEKYGFGIFPEAGQAQLVDPLHKQYEDPSEQAGNLVNEAPVSGPVAGQNGGAAAGQGGGGAAAGQNGGGAAAANGAGTSSGQSGAASAGGKIGPSMVTQIVTLGESGLTQGAILGGAKLTMLQSQSDQQMLSCIIQTSQGKQIVIDGGMGADAGYLLNQLWAGGGHVGAWLVTHPHGDHVGALYGILENQERNLTIDGIYYSLAEPEWYTGRDPQEATMAAAMINTLAQVPAEMRRSDIGKGYEFMVDDVKIQVMNSRYDATHDAGNNASIVYKVTAGGKSILFLGDLAAEGGKRLLEDCGDNLKADIVQMSHHGQNGVNEAVYRAINPSICLWPTPQWLWDNNKGSGINSGSWQITTTKGWMNRINPAILHYVSKDGDQMIE